MTSKQNKTITDQEIDELVAHIDNFMSKNNAGHLNVKINENGHVNKEELYVDNTGNCCLSSCKAPTLFDGLDCNEENEE